MSHHQIISSKKLDAHAATIDQNSYYLGFDVLIE